MAAVTQEGYAIEYVDQAILITALTKLIKTGKQI